MKRLFKPSTRQAIFFPACRSCLVHRSPTTLNLLRRLYLGVGGSAGRLLPLSLFLITACPDPPGTTDCGTHQVEVNGDCECDDGYHWNEDKSKCLMDTTSHNYFWQYDEPNGWALTSQWSDVTIIDENNVWVAGLVFSDEYDSIIGFHPTSNAAHWDGNDWTLKNITMRRELIETSVVELDSYRTEISSIFSINDDVLFMTYYGHHAYLIDGEWVYYENKRWSYFYPLSSMWGTSLNNMYFACEQSGIVHDNGTGYKFYYKISGRDIFFAYDMWGLDDNHIWAVGCDGTNRLCQIIYYDGSYWQEIYFMDVDEWYPDNVNPDTLNGHVYAVWAFEDTVYYGTVHGLWRESVTTHKGYMVKFEDWGLDNFRIRKIRGNGYNDIFVAGHAGQVVHFNGKSWKVIHLMDTLIEIKSMAIKNDMIVLVGHDDNIVALTIRGYR